MKPTKIRHQILLLLGIPLLIQLFTIGWLLFSLARIDDAAVKEANTKRIVYVCQESIGLIGNIVFQLVNPTFIGDRGDPERAKMQVRSFLQKSAELQLLVKDNPKALTLAKRLTRDSKSFMVNLDDLVRSYDSETGKMFFSEVLTTREFMEQFKVVWERLQQDLNQLIGMYSPVEAEFQPHGVRTREQMRIIILIVLAVNLITVIVLAFSVNKNILSRLQLLMQNMESFSRAKQDFVPLKGSDELSELNSAFKRVADERDKLDELRRSLQAMISHDIRSPLAGIMVSMEFILDSFHETLVPTVANQLTRAVSELRRLSRLVRTLLDIEKMETGHLDLNIEHHYCMDLIQPAVSAVQSLAERKNTTIKILADEMLELDCDADRTVQVLVNLLSNAIKFAPPGSSISVAVERLPNGSLQFQVKDEGPGIPADNVSKLFAKFSQLDQPESIKKQGSGLGLFICRLLVEAHKGELGYSPVKPTGACFWFNLPDFAQTNQWTARDQHP